MIVVQLDFIKLESRKVDNVVQKVGLGRVNMYTYENKNYVITNV